MISVFVCLSILLCVYHSVHGLFVSALQCLFTTSDRGPLPPSGPVVLFCRSGSQKCMPQKGDDRAGAICRNSVFQRCGSFGRALHPATRGSICGSFKLLRSPAQVVDSSSRSEAFTGSSSAQQRPKQKQQEETPQQELGRLEDFMQERRQNQQNAAQNGAETCSVQKQVRAAWEDEEHLESRSFLQPVFQQHIS